PTGKRCGLSSPLASGIYASFISAMGGAGESPVPQHVLQSVQHADWATNSYFTTNPTATSGPYMVQNFTPGPAAQVVMVPNPNYAAGRTGAQLFGHAPYLDKLIYKIYGDKPSQIAGLKAGDSDLGLDLIAKDGPASCSTATAGSRAQTAPGARTGSNWPGSSAPPPATASGLRRRSSRSRTGPRSAPPSASRTGPPVSSSTTTRAAASSRPATTTWACTPTTGHRTRTVGARPLSPARSRPTPTRRVRTGRGPTTPSWIRCASRAPKRSTPASVLRSTRRSRRNGRTTCRPSSSTSDLTSSRTRTTSATSPRR